MSDQPQGPSHETLAHLKGMLPSFIKGMEKKRAHGLGKAIQVLRPTKVCPICGEFHCKIRAEPMADIRFKVTNCERCSYLLETGWIAFICGEHYAFARDTKHLSDMAGSIVRVSPNVFDELTKKFNVQRKQNSTSQEHDAAVND